MEDRDILIQEKYAGNAAAAAEDLARLSAGEPLAYVIGSIPFLDVTVHLDSRPLIPRPETEWWAEELVKHVGNQTLSVLDLCTGSGAIGLAVLKHCPNARVSFGELIPAHVALIKKNIEANGLDASRADVRESDLFAAFTNERFDVIATNPPYIPEGRTLDASVTAFEPGTALYGGADGLSIIRKIAETLSAHLTPKGELWMECDIENIRAAKTLLEERAFSAEIRTDLYGRERLLVAH